MNYLYPITAINRDGVTRLLYSADEVRAFRRSLPCHNRWEAGRIGAEWVRESRYDYARSVYNYIYNDWILRDDRGRPVPESTFDLPHENWKDRKGNFIYRNGPVPGRTHHNPWKMNHTAKKNSGAGARNRNRSIAAEDFAEYGIKNTLGSVRHWEGY